MQAFDERHFFSFSARLRTIGDLTPESPLSARFTNPRAGTILANYVPKAFSAADTIF
jgi:hypothetical protein